LFESKNSISNNEYNKEVIGVKDVAQFLGRSISWVYEHYQDLGGVKIGGSLLFPSQKEIYERLFRPKKEILRVRFPVQRGKVLEGGFQDKKSRDCGTGKKKKKLETGEDPNRHGLLGAC
jgi:predicted DNA-binding transcriptional regulator AlpA